jgi:hypothetical protein
MRNGYTIRCQVGPVKRNVPIGVSAWDNRGDMKYPGTCVNRSGAWLTQRGSERGTA